MIAELTAAAEADLEAIGDYIAQDNPIRALSFVRELFRNCTELADMPEAWHGPSSHVRGPRCSPPCSWPVLILYRGAADGIVILYVLNGAMDVEAILFPNG